MADTIMYATSPVMIEIIFFAFINPDLSVFYLYFFYHLGWNTSNNGIGLHVLCHYCTSSYYGSIANGYSSKNGGIGSNPYVFANVDGGIRHTLAVGWVKVVVDSCQYDVVTDECTLVNGDATLSPTMVFFPQSVWNGGNRPTVLGTLRPQSCSSKSCNCSGV